MGQDESTKHWTAELGRVRTDVAALAKRMEQPQEIDTSSSLAADDKGFPSIRLASTVGYKIAVSAEHLDFALRSIKSLGTSPTAQLTLLRTALLAASHAATLLEGDRTQRRGRALKLRADDLRGQLTMIRASAAISPVSAAATSELTTYLTEQQSELQVTADDLGLTIDVRKFTFNHTGAVVEAAKRAYPTRPETVSLVERIWRLGSSAAHAERSFASRRGVATLLAPGFGQLKADLADLGMAAVASWAILHRTVQGFDLRRTAHY